MNFTELTAHGNELKYYYNLKIFKDYLKCR